jgi:hypothetical protein
MRNQLVLMSLLLCAATPAGAQVSVAIGLPNVRIGINLPVYPQLVRVPGYPVYYAPDEDWNYFFYDGMYWVYQDDYWYSSSWYNGPWDMVEPDFVPLFVLRVPVRYYRRPPIYFRGWQSDRPPRWGDHWGNDWSRRRSGWDQWNHQSAPRPAPLPLYQRQYSGDRYPRVEQQSVLRNQNYKYQPLDPQVRQREQPQRNQPAPIVTPPRPDGRAEGRPEQPPERQQPRNTPPRVNERNQTTPPGQTQQNRPQPNRQNVPDAPRGEVPVQDRSNRQLPTAKTNEVTPQRRETPREQSPQPQPRSDQRPRPAPATRDSDAAPPQSRREQNSGKDAERDKDRNNEDRGRGRQ